VDVASFRLTGHNAKAAFIFKGLDIRVGVDRSASHREQK
jgi:hypothetical protein